jgi:hypothetical protein
MTMRVLVCGGRNFADLGWFGQVMTELHVKCGPITLIIHGAASGADTMAGEWAEHMVIPLRVFPADWATHGRAAGPIRNGQMLCEGKPDLVVAFPGGRGTENMIHQARAIGVEVYRPVPR